MSEPTLAEIGLPTWRVDAISRTLAMYDTTDVDGEPLVKVKRGAGDEDRYSAVLELVEEVYSEAAALLHASRASAKVKLTTAIARLNEISLDGREFAATSATTYDWRDKPDDDLEEVLAESVKRSRIRKPQGKGANNSAPKMTDAAIRKVVKDTAKDEPPMVMGMRTSARSTAKTRATKAPAKTTGRSTTKTSTTSRKRTSR